MKKIRIYDGTNPKKNSDGSDTIIRIPPKGPRIDEVPFDPDDLKVNPGAK